MKNLLLVFGIGCGLAGTAAAQNILLKDGKTIVSKGLRRSGDQILATVVLPGGDDKKTGEFGYPLTAIAKLEFAEPPVLDAAPGLIAQGKAAEALTRLEPVVTYYGGFRDAPGSWWAQSAMLKVQALLALGRGKDAEGLVDQLVREASDPETVRAAEVQRALGMLSKGVPPKGLEIAERALTEAKRASTRAAASVLKGSCLLAQKQWEDALVAFLAVPVFYPNEKMLLPQSQLGAGRVYFAIEDFTSAKAVLEELIKTSGSLPEAELAKTELEKIARREKALAPPK